MPDPLDKIASVLEKHRLPYDAAPSAYKAYVYAYFIHDGVAVLPVMTEENGLLYVGLGEDGVEGREHFTQSSGFSPLRRLLGAALKERLSLQAVARGKGSAISNVRHYKFTRAGEARLSAWMREHLTYAECPVAGDILLLERAIIGRMQPPLCVGGWKNPQGTLLRHMQKVCADEAWDAVAKAS